MGVILPATLDYLLRWVKMDNEILTYLQNMSNSIFTLEQKFDGLKDDIHQIDVKVEKAISEGDGEHKHTRESLDYLRTSLREKVNKNSQDLRDAKSTMKTIKALGSLLLAVALIAGGIGAFIMIFK